MVPKRRIIKYIATVVGFYIVFGYFYTMVSTFASGNNEPNEPELINYLRTAPLKVSYKPYINDESKVQTASKSPAKKSPAKQFGRALNEPVFKRGDCTASNLTIKLPSGKDTWKTAFIKPHPFHVFSAYLDEPDRKKLKIIAISTSSMDVYCQLWYEHNEMHITPAQSSIIPETHGYQFVPIIVTCGIPSRVSSVPSRVSSVPSRVSSIPIAVSLVLNKCDNPEALLSVHSRPKIWKPTHNFTLCPAPLNREYSKLGEWLQYIEVNGLFGADHYIFYNHSVSHSLDPFIDYYVENGKVEIFQWRIPVSVKQGPTNEIHYFGQVIAQSECFHRAMMNSRYVVSLDMDEVLVPMKTPDWQSAIGSDPNVAAYMFPNVFFRKEWKQNQVFENHELMQKYPIDALLYTNREPKIWRYGARSKYIARPEAISLIGIHQPLRLKAGYSRSNIPSDVGILAHFRNWEDYRDSQKVKETRMHDFSFKILQRISQVVSDVQA